MKYKAHDYQQYAADFILEHPVSCLILDMGLGKTVVTLSALHLLLFDYFEVSRISGYCPEAGGGEYLAGGDYKVGASGGITVFRGDGDGEAETGGS